MGAVIVDAALHSGFVHVSVHALLLVSSLIVWMPIVSPLPETRPLKVALVLAPALHLLEPRARHQVRREHSRGAQLGHDVRHVDVRMAVVVAREQLL